MMMNAESVLDPRPTESSHTDFTPHTQAPGGGPIPTLPHGTGLAPTLPVAAGLEPGPNGPGTATPRPVPGGTKILLTLTPLVAHATALQAVMEAGVSAFRLNLAQLPRDAALKAVYAIRSISTELKRPVALLLDTQPLQGGAPDLGLTENELADIHFGLECGVDWFAVPAGREGRAIRQLREFLTDARRGNVGVLARIEQDVVVSDLDSVLGAADGLMFDDSHPSGVEGDWRPLARRCVAAGKLAVAVATTPADSLRTLSEQPDALCFDEGILDSQDPIGAVESLKERIRLAEREPRVTSSTPAPGQSESDQTVAAAIQQSSDSAAGTLVILTRSGQAATSCAAARPQGVRALVLTPDARLARRLRLNYALESFVLPFPRKPRATLPAAERFLRAHRLVAKGANIVFLTDPPESESGDPAMEIRALP